MGVNTNNVIAFMVGLKNQGITYSMNGRRDGSDGTGDCSGTIVRAIERSGGTKASWLYNTDSMHSYLIENGYKLVYENQDSYNPKRGDIFIWGKRGQSGGAFGHTGIFYDDNENIIHCNYGYNGVSINNVDSIAKANGFPYYYIYRLETAPKPPKPQPPVTNKPNYHSGVLGRIPSNFGCLDGATVKSGNATHNVVHVHGWHYASGEHETIIFLNADTGKEIGRVKAPSIERKDVQKAYNYPYASATGFKVDGLIPKGMKVMVLARTYTKDWNKDGTDLLFPITIKA